MRTSPIRAVATTLALIACTSVPAIAAVGDLTRFPTPSPGGAFPQDPTVGPDGATWFFGTYGTDPGIASRARRRAPGQRPNGVAPCCSRLIRVGLDGSVSSRGAAVFGATAIGGLTTFAGELWALVSDAPGTGPYRAVAYSVGGSARSFPMASAGYEPIAGPDGNLWYWQSGAIGRISPFGSSLAPVFSGATMTVLAPGDGVAWTANNTPSLLRIAADGTTASTPTPSIPGTVAASADGFVWYTDPGSNALGRRAPDGTVVESIDLSRHPTGIAPSADGIAWVTDANSGRIYRVTPALAVEAITVPDAIATNAPIIGSDGNLWFQYLRSGGGYGFGRVLTGVIPTSTSAPVASGRVATGQALTTTPGEWRYAPTGHAYQWQRCDGDNPATCADIPGAAGASHVVSAADIGRGLRVRVSATNLNGTAAAVASNILTAGTPPSNAITVRAPTRRGYVISTVVTVPGPGTLRQVGTVSIAPARTEREGAGQSAVRVTRACAPRPVTTAAAGRRTVRCVLSTRVRRMLASKRVVVTLRTTFTNRAGGATTVTRRVTVPRIRARR